MTCNGWKQRQYTRWHRQWCKRDQSSHCRQRTHTTANQLHQRSIVSHRSASHQYTSHPSPTKAQLGASSRSPSAFLVIACHLRTCIHRFMYIAVSVIQSKSNLCTGFCCGMVHGAWRVPACMNASARCDVEICMKLARLTEPLVPVDAYACRAGDRQDQSPCRTATSCKERADALQLSSICTCIWCYTRMRVAAACTYASCRSDPNVSHVEPH